MYPAYQPNFAAGAERQAYQQAQAMRPPQAPPPQRGNVMLPQNAGTAFTRPGGKPYSPPITTRQPYLPPQQPRPQSLGAMYGGMV